MGFKLFLLLEKFLIILPKSFRKAFFLMLASLAYRVSKRHRTISYQNLDFAFDGKLSEKEKMISQDMLLKIWPLTFYTL